MHITADIILILIPLTQFLNVCAHINIYRHLPPLYDFDNYDQCLSQSLSVYCIVFAEIEPNDNNDIWLKIKNNSDLLNKYHHENLFFGTCIEWCKELLDRLTSLEVKQFSGHKNFKNEITDYFQRIHKRLEDYDDHFAYQNIVDICLNYKFFQKYNLSIMTNIEYCVKSVRTHKLDLLDIIFCTILSLIILLNVASSVFDYWLKVQYSLNSENNEFYKKKLKDSTSILLTSFSICRNYFRITGVSLKSEGTYESDLKFTYAFRVFTLFIVILGHCIMLLMSIQIQNPEFIENYYYYAQTMLFQNGSALIQIFFVLAGFLLKFKFDQYKLVTPETKYFRGLLVYIQCFLNRYFRLFPSLLMVILFNATFLIHMWNGPFWRHISEADYIFCREYWWKNFFMINNFMLENSCAQHTWFLAADMQLYELFLFTVILTAKFKFWKKPLYIVYGLCACLVPGFLTYIYGLDAIHYLKPESYRYLYFKDVDTFYLTYPQFYCNIGGYLVGFVCAEVYVKAIRPPNSHKTNKITKYRGVIKFEVSLMIVIFLIGIGLLLSGNLVINSNIQKPSIWLSLYASLYRNIWSIFGGLILLLMLLKMGWIAYEIACLPLFRILGRISFQSYLWHVTVLRLLEGFYRQPVYLNEFFIICQIILTFIITNIVAFFMALFVEYPIGEIIHHILKPKMSTYGDDDDNHNEMKPHLVEIHL